MQKLGAWAVGLVALLGVGAGACGGGGGFDSPEAVGKALVDAVNAGSADKIKALFPSDDAIKAAVTCKDAKDDMAADVAKRRDKLAEELQKDLKGMTLEWIGIEEKETDKIAKGSEKSGCTYATDVEVKRVTLKFKMTKEGKSEDESEGGTMISVGGRWYLAKL